VIVLRAKIYGVFLAVIAILAVANVFVYMNHVESINKLTYLEGDYNQLNCDYELLKNETNKMLSLLVIQYGNCLQNASQDLDIAWKKRGSEISWYNYKVYAPLFYIRDAIDLIKQAHDIAKLYEANSTLFQTLSRIRHNETWRDIIRGLEFTYGHMYYYGVKLGDHEIDVNLLAWCENCLGKIAKFLSVIKADGTPLEVQIPEETMNELHVQYGRLQDAVDEYLSKPGTEIE
jgi:hypothetical protein